MQSARSPKLNNFEPRICHMFSYLHNLIVLP